MRPHLPHPPCLRACNTTDQPISSSTPDIEENENNRQWCYCCQTEDYDQMISCDGKDCTFEWFHWSCVNLTEETVPTGQWYCVDCC